MNFWFSQNVARVVRRSGFIGMLVPGVRGDSISRYANLTMFDPTHHWEKWSVGSIGFRPPAQEYRTARPRGNAGSKHSAHATVRALAMSRSGHPSG